MNFLNRQTGLSAFCLFLRHKGYGGIAEKWNNKLRQILLKDFAINLKNNYKIFQYMLKFMQ